MISGIKNLIAFMQEIWHYVSKNIDFGYAMIQYMSFGHKSKLHSIPKEKQMIFTVFTKKTNSSPKSLEAKLQSLDNALEKLELLYDCLYCNRSKNRFAYFKDCDLNTPLPPFPKLFHKITFTTPDINPPTQKHLLTGAANRVKNHLAYKLGSCLILNSKSLLGYIRMPYALSYLKAQHKMEQEKYQKTLQKIPPTSFLNWNPMQITRKLKRKTILYL